MNNGYLHMRIPEIYHACTSLDLANGVENILNDENCTYIT